MYKKCYTHVNTLKFIFQYIEMSKTALSISTNDQMQIRKRDGKLEDVSFDKIMRRIRGLSYNLQVEPSRLAQNVIGQLYTGITSSQIDELSAKEAHHRITVHPDYDVLAAKIAISNHQKETIDEFSIVMLELFENGQLSDEFHQNVQDNADVLDAIIDYERDGYLTYHGFNTFMRSYGLRIKGKVIERPQHMWMRVAVGIWGNNIERVKETYEWMSRKYFIHASPTLFNCGSKIQQLSSCFLVAMKTEDQHPGDSIPKIFETLSDCAKISKTAGGIGLSVSNIRATGSPITTTGRESNGIVPMLKMFEAMARYVDQGRKRKGAVACYLEPWHGDVFEFIQLRKNTGAEELRARDLHLAMWIPDLFMKRVQQNEKWSLMSPFDCPGLYECHGKEFEELYTRYEKEGKFIRQIDAQELFVAIISAQIETGEPYVLYKDHINHKNNQSNLGTIRSSNLCVSPNTKILTKNGYKPIKTLKDKEVDVWNGFEWSPTIIRKTGTNVDLLRVKLSNGAEIECTPEHKFYINQSYYSKTHRNAFCDEKYTKCMKAKNLNKGDKLIKTNFPLMKKEFENNNNFQSPYTHGFFCGDGMLSNRVNGKLCECKSINTTNYCERHQYYDKWDMSKKHYNICQAINGDSKIIRLYGEKKKLLTHIDHYNSYENNNKITNTSAIIVAVNPLIADKYVVPLNECLSTKLMWFAGYCDANGTIAENESTKSLQTCSTVKEFQNDIRLMLSTMGIHSKVIDGKGGEKKYKYQATYRLVVSSNGLKKLIDLGFSPKRLDISDFKTPNRNTEQFIEVVSVEEIPMKNDTYCFTEKILGLGTFEGVVTGQCSEIVEYSDNNKTAVCNLSSIALASFVRGFKGGDEEDEGVEPYFDFDNLQKVVRIVTRNLNRVIDINFYPTFETKNSNMSERPMGIGVQGLADCFIRMRYPFDSPEAEQLNRDIFECIYYSAVSESCNIAKVQGTYDSYEGSPMSYGKFQFDLWRDQGYPVKLSGRWDWDALRKDVLEHGIRNSLFVALMPTASTSQLLGFNECFEPYTSNMYTRRTLAGSYKIVNKQLIHDLIDLGLWSTELKDKILFFDGSIQPIPEIPQDIKDLYKTSWDLKQKVIVDMSADRAPFVDQTQSLNIHIAIPDVAQMASLHMHSWARGLKTGMYYLRTNPSHKAIQVTIDPRLGAQALKASAAHATALATQALATSPVEDPSSIPDDSVVGLPPLPSESDKDSEGWACLKEDGCVSCGS